MGQMSTRTYYERSLDSIAVCDIYMCFSPQVVRVIRIQLAVPFHVKFSAQPARKAFDPSARKPLREAEVRYHPLSAAAGVWLRWPLRRFPRRQVVIAGSQ